jgi:carbon starvation protein
VVIFKMKRQRYAWVTAVPAAVMLVCTITAGLQKLFSPDPALGFLAQAAKFSAAAQAGEVLRPAKSMDQMNQIILNARIDAVLCVFFILVSLSILVFAVRAVVAAYRDTEWTAREHPLAAE